MDESGCKKARGLGNRETPDQLGNVPNDNFNADEARICFSSCEKKPIAAVSAKIFGWKYFSLRFGEIAALRRVHPYSKVWGLRNWLIEI